MGKIYFNAMILDFNPTGLGIYTENILKRLLKYNLIDYVICKNKEYILNNVKGIDKNQLIHIECPDNRLKILHRNSKIEKYIKRNLNLNEDILYSPTQHGIILSGLKQIITIHDLIPIFYSKHRVHQYIYYRYIIPIFIKRVECVVTISQNTKRDIIDYYGLNDEKIKVIYNGYDKPKLMDKQMSIEYVEKVYNIKDYLLMMGINYSYKNLHRVIEAYFEIKNTINQKLIIVGNYNNSYGKYLQKLVKKLKLQNDVIFLGYVSNEERERLYQAANCFIYPSIYEGFGLPLLEAMANGIPVLCSNTSVHSEVVGDAAVMFNPLDIKDIKIKLLNVISYNNEQREEAILKGYLNINRFSWESTVEGIAKILIKLK